MRSNKQVIFLHAVLQCHYASQHVRRREVLRDMPVHGTSSEPYVNIWVGKNEGSTDVS